MAMSKKHFEMIAARVRAEKSHNDDLQAQHKISANEHIHCYDSLRDLASKMAADFIGDNPQFDRKRFMTACGF